MPGGGCVGLQRVHKVLLELAASMHPADHLRSAVGDEHFHVELALWDCRLDLEVILVDCGLGIDHLAGSLFSETDAEEVGRDLHQSTS